MLSKRIKTKYGEFLARIEDGKITGVNIVGILGSQKWIDWDKLLEEVQNAILDVFDEIFPKQ